MQAQRERILRAAIMCISRKGVEGTSVTDIHTEAGLSAGTLYVHFQNKEDLIAEALRYCTVSAPDLPDTWADFKAMVVSLQDQLGFDIETVVRTRVHLHAECVNPGRLHDIYRPILNRALTVLTDHLAAMEEKGRVKLRMRPRQTALAISALIDGMLWTALASDRPLEEVRPELSAGLDCFVIS
jgi:AcrR family transcriptional regulator